MTGLLDTKKDFRCTSAEKQMYGIAAPRLGFRNSGALCRHAANVLAERGLAGLSREAAEQVAAGPVLPALAFTFADMGVVRELTTATNRVGGLLNQEAAALNRLALFADEHDYEAIDRVVRKMGAIDDRSALEQDLVELRERLLRFVDELERRMGEAAGVARAIQEQAAG